MQYLLQYCPLDLTLPDISRKFPFMLPFCSLVGKGRGETRIKIFRVWNIQVVFNLLFIHVLVLSVYFETCGGINYFAL